MNARLASLLFLTLFAFGRAQANRDCNEARVTERVRDCLSGVLRLSREADPSIEEACREARNAERCMRRVADECLDGEERAEVERHLSVLMETLARGCPETESTEDASKDCMKDNEDYILGCAVEVQTRALSRYSRQLMPDQNEVLCTVYNWTADCLTERAGEKCGKAARDETREALNNPPQAIKDACRERNQPFGKIQAGNECSEARITARVRDCLSGVLNSVYVDSPSIEETCRAVSNAESCMRAVVNECLDGEEKAAVDRQLDEMLARVGQRCPAPATQVSTNADANEACVEENKDYILGCIRQNQMRALTHFSRQSNPDQNDVVCTVYNWIADCVTERAEERCGKAAGDELREELGDPPQEIQDACAATNHINRYSLVD